MKISIGGVSALGLALGGFLAGAPARAEVTASQAAAAESAQAKADHYEKVADHYRGFGGQGLKAGLVEQAEREAAHYQKVADQAWAGTESPPTNAQARARTPLTPQCDATKAAAQDTTCRE
jgi:hypothetical protein